MEFICDESCGKCSPCRIGTKRILEILEKITKGKGTLQDLADLEDLSEAVKANSLCGLGQTAANPVLSTMRQFKDEYIAHVVDKQCPAHICKDLMQYVIVPETCKGCSKCSRVCPVGAISGVIKQPFVIDQNKCIKCGMCISSCPFHAIIKK
jgi:NADP-reducing hydrogenase subunit HndC